MILTGTEIQEQVAKKRIIAHPFIEEHLTANAYDVTLSDTLLTYTLGHDDILDMRRDNPTVALKIPESGLILKPGILYLGATNESVTSQYFVPMFEGRSSIGRLGISVHITAGFGDIGWGFFQDPKTGLASCTYPSWTLEITVVHPTRIYADVRIGQVYFFKPCGRITLYGGKYNDQKEPISSRLYKDFLSDSHERRGP